MHIATCFDSKESPSGYSLKQSQLHIHVNILGSQNVHRYFDISATGSMNSLMMMTP